MSNVVAAEIFLDIAFIMLCLIIGGVAIMIVYLRAWALRRKRERQSGETIQ